MKKKRGAKKSGKKRTKLGEPKDKQKLFHSRKYSRIPLEMKVEYENGGGFASGETRDISQGGIYIKSKKPLEGGAVTRIRFILDKEKEAVEIEGKVAWTTEEGDRKHKAHPKGMGIEFTDEDLNRRKVVKEFVRDLTDLLRIMSITNHKKDN